MAVISVNTPKRRGKIIDDNDEFQGLWLNIGIRQTTGEEGSEPTFVRLPRGVAVSDLKPRKIYDNMDPDFAAQANLMNQIIAEVQKRSLTLKEGEAIPINLEVQLYRRQEESTQTETPEASADLATALFAAA